MIYPDIRPEEWAELHDLPRQQQVCPVCKEMVWVDVPFIMKDMNGFEMRKHGFCKYTGEYIMTPRSKEAKEFWDKVIGKL